MNRPLTPIVGRVKVPAFVSKHPIAFRVAVIGWWLLLAAIAYWLLGWRWLAYICVAVAALDALLLPGRLWLERRRRAPPDHASLG
jgi:hypothetical protein